MSTTPGPRGLRLWVLVALPLVVQFGFVGLGAAILNAFSAAPAGDTSLTSLPQAVLLVVAYVVFGATIWLVARQLGDPREVLALRRVPLARAAALAVGGLIVGVAAAALLEPIFHGSSSQRISAGDIDSLTTGVAFGISAFTIVVGAALTEELYFRGLLYGRLDGRFGVASAVVGSAGVFGLAHFEPNAFPALFALGLVLGLVRMRSSSVWPGMAIHGANNVIAVAGLLLAAN
ncbi:MAG: CPBP family intramembrane glutamic endopeptidase [Gaiellales bacterium]